MTEIDYTSHFHDALTKAFAAQAPDVRAAYFDLARFYHQKLPSETVPFAAAETLRQSLPNTR